MYLTYNMSTEGVGAQYQRILGLLGICKVHGLKYIHNKITVGHNYEHDPEWHDKWDEFFNIKDLCYEDNINRNIIKFFEINSNDIPYISNDTNNLFMITLARQILDGNPDLYYGIIQNDIRTMYDNNNLSRNLNYYDKNKTNIAIHIRVINDYDDKEEIESFENLHNRYEIYDYEYAAYIIMMTASIMVCFPITT